MLKLNWNNRIQIVLWCPTNQVFKCFSLCCSVFFRFNWCTGRNGHEQNSLRHGHSGTNPHTNIRTRTQTFIPNRQANRRVEQTNKENIAERNNRPPTWYLHTLTHTPARTHTLNIDGAVRWKEWRMPHYVIW